MAITDVASQSPWWEAMLLITTGCSLYFFPDFYANFNVGAFHLMIERLPDVMKQTGTFRQCNVFSQFSRHKPGQVRHFHGVLEHVLAIACTKLQTSQDLDQIRVQAVNANLERGLLAIFTDALVHFLAGFLHHFFNAGRMDPSVSNQLLQRGAGDLAADRVKARQDDGFRRIVDDQVNPRQRLKRTDVASFASDDAALHLFVRQRDDGYRRFGYVIGCAALDGKRNDLSCLLVGVFLSLRFDFFDHLRGFVTYLLLDIGEDNRTGLFHGQRGDAFQLRHLVTVQLVDLRLCLFNAFLLVRNLLFFALQRIDLLIQRFFFLQQSPLLPLNFVAALANVFFSFGAEPVNLVLGLHHRFLLQRFGILLGVLYNLLGCLFGAGNLSFSNGFADKKTDSPTGQSCNERD
jgi:hypothetical protein